MNTNGRLFILDAYALIYRSYYAFINNPRMNSKGENTSAIFGFLITLEDLIKKQQPSHLAVAFDPHGPTFRHLAYDQYKAQREKTPEVITWSVPFIKELLKAYSVPVIEVEGFEADDVIGTLAKQAEKAGMTTYMVSPDKDLGQLVSEKTLLFRPKFGSGEFVAVGPEEVMTKYGLTNTLQMIDYLGLVGDSSDNIPGCPGVGDVSARKLLSAFGSIESLLQHTDQLKGALKEKIETNREMIEFSRFLATIRTDVPIDVDLNELKRAEVKTESLQKLYERLEFRSHLNKLSSMDERSKRPSATPQVILGVAPTQNFKTPKSSSKQQASPIGQFSLWDEPATEMIGSTSTPERQIPETNIQTSEQDNAVAFVQNNTQDDLFLESEIAVNPDHSSENIKYSNLRSLNETQHSYYLIDNERDLEAFLAKISVQKSMAFDTETTGLDALSAELVGMSFSWGKNEAYYLPYSENAFGQKMVQALKPILEDDNILKVGQNLKYDILVLNKYGIDVSGPLFDTMVAHYLIQPELRHGMDYMAEIYLNYRTIHIDALLGPKGKGQKNMRDLRPEQILDYAAEDADVTWQLKEVLEKEIQSLGMEYLCYEVEMPLVKVLADMEIAGVGINRAALKESSVKLTEAVSKLETEIQEMAGVPFNVNSPKQIGEVLFNTLQLDKKAKKTKTGQYTTNEDVLERLKSKHPIVEKILEQRGLKKLLSTYVDALPSLINPETGKLHTSFNQTVTSTGRLSSSNPNLQNIPVRDAIGREIRKTFSAEKGYLFLSADYSQIELRLMAHLSQDASMLEAFQKDQDIHAATAAKIYKVGLEDVHSDMRRKAKTANFGIIYGISVFGLAERMNVSRTEAKELIDGYFETYPSVKAYMEESIEKARNNGWVETLYHRKRYLQDIHSQNANVRGYAERNAINAPIQGTAADIIKIAMVNLHRALKSNGLHTKMILQVHDELNFIVPVNELEQVQKLVLQEMEHAVSLDVPLKADLGIGQNWLEAHS